MTIKCKLAHVGAFLGFLAAYVLLGVWFGFLFSGFGPIGASMVADVVFFVFSVFLYRRLHRTAFCDDTRPYSLFSSIWRAIFLFILWFCVFIIGNLIALAMPDPELIARAEIQDQYIVLFLILSFFIAPVVEEVMFRGVSYILLRSCFNIWIAAAASSIAFGVLHGTIPQAFIGALFGIGQCFLFEYTHKLRWCIVMHMLVNMASFGIACLNIEVDLFLNWSVVLFLAVIAIISLVIMVPENRL